MARKIGLVVVLSVTALLLPSESEAGFFDFWRKLCEAVEAAFNGSEARIELINEIEDVDNPNYAADVAAASKAAIDAHADATNAAEDALKSAPGTSLDLGKTPTDAALDAFKETAKEILKEGVNAVIPQSLSPLAPLVPPIGFEALLADVEVDIADLEVLDMRLWNGDPDTGEPLDRAYVLAHRLPVAFFDDPTAPVTLGLLDVSTQIQFSQPISLDVLKTAFAADTGLNTLGFVHLFNNVRKPSMPFFDDGLLSAGFVLWELEIPNTLSGDIMGPVGLSGQMFITSNACCVPEPATLSLFAAGFAALRFRHRRRS